MGSNGRRGGSLGIIHFIDELHVLIFFEYGRGAVSGISMSIHPKGRGQDRGQGRGRGGFRVRVGARVRTLQNASQSVSPHQKGQRPGQECSQLE